MTALAFDGTRVWAGVAPAPEPSVLAKLEKLRARKMGVDRAGNLWVWGSGLGMVTVISPAGLDLGLSKASDALTVDVDGEWGVVGLFLDGHEIRRLNDDGEPRAAIRLGGPAADVCWLGPDLVAVTPQMAGHRIEVWNLRQGTLVKTLGEEIPLRPVPGATRMRAVLLRHDFERGLLYSLESFTGDLQVFDREGRLAWRTEIENPRRPERERWLREVDATARTQRDVQTPLVFSLRLALSPQGDLWVLQRWDEERHELTLLQIRPDGRSAHTLPAGSCPGYDFILWGERLLTFRKPEATQGTCAGWLPLPSGEHLEHKTEAVLAHHDARARCQRRFASTKRDRTGRYPGLWQFQLYLLRPSCLWLCTRSRPHFQLYL